MWLITAGWSATPAAVDCSGHLESADLFGADAWVAFSGSDQVGLMAGEAAVSY